MGMHIDFAKLQHMHCGSYHIDHAVLVLQRAVHSQKLAASHGNTVPLV